MSAYSICRGDVAAVLREFRDDSFDALLCDPPYGFSFMGKGWDYAVPSVETWAECLRVLKPGAPLVAFGGARTYHRLAVGVEDAGFEMRDCLMWLYGKGFPKSQNIALAIDKSAGATRQVVGTRVLTGNAGVSLKDKGGTYGVQVGSAGNVTVPVTAPATALAQAWDGYGTALKPAHEPIVLARKPLAGTMVANVRAYGVGGLNVAGCRIEAHGRLAIEHARRGATSFDCGSRAVGTTDEGRWPANLILDEDAGALLDASVAPTRSTPYPANEAEGNVLPLTKRTAGGYADAGGPSRFFYTAKVSTKEREAGCEGLQLRSAGEVTGRNDYASDAPWIVEGGEPSRPAGLDNPRAGAGRTGGARNHHPTLKPLALTTWLARLILPPAPGALLVPFSGAGSEMIGALKAGWPCVFGIEQDPEYIQIARARLAHWCPDATEEGSEAA